MNGYAARTAEHDRLSEILRGQFHAGMGTYPRTGRKRVHSLLALSDEVPDHLAQAGHAAAEWGAQEAPRARLIAQLFVVTQHGLVYAAALADDRRRLYYLATPAGLFEPFVERVDTGRPYEDAVVAVDRRCASELAAAHPMDAALRHLLDEHLALRVDLPA